MKLNYLQHVPFEGLGSIADWAASRGHEVCVTRLFAGDPLPEEFDGLIVLGGPMSIHDVTEFPWLKQEREFLRALSFGRRPVLGICLGAQLLADALGARVFPNFEAEIGWHPIDKSPEAKAATVGVALPDELEVFHWHGETFDIPSGAVALAMSEATANQGFSFQDRLVGLQFHLEATPDWARALIEHCGNGLVEGPFIQDARTMLEDPERFAETNQVMDELLDVFFAGE